MTDTPAGSSMDFAASFKADQMVAQPEKPGPFLERSAASWDGAARLGRRRAARSAGAPQSQRRSIVLVRRLKHEILGVSIDPYGRASLADLLGQRGDQAPQPGPVEYVNVALDTEVLPCIQNGLYLVTGGKEALAVFVRGPNEAGFRAKVYIEVMAARREGAESFLADLRRRMREGNVYRGRVLSLFVDEMRSLRVGFHRLGGVERQAIILPEGLLERVERQTLRFSAHAERLRALGRHMKRGLLLRATGNGKDSHSMSSTRCRDGPCSC
jgi:hypothetical protein